MPESAGLDEPQSAAVVLTMSAPACSTSISTGGSGSSVATVAPVLSTFSKRRKWPGWSPAAGPVDLGQPADTPVLKPLCLCLPSAHGVPVLPCSLPTLDPVPGLPCVSKLQGCLMKVLRPCCCLLLGLSLQQGLTAQVPGVVGGHVPACGAWCGSAVAVLGALIVVIRLGNQ